METILNTLVYDGKAEVTVQVAMETADSEGGNVRLYRVANPFLTSAGLDHIPCAVCPVSTHAHTHTHTRTHAHTHGIHISNNLGFLIAGSYVKCVCLSLHVPGVQ